jgi:glycosyltransferase involved in cell wall biosynthesis
MKLISIIVPCYNYGSLLGQTLSNLLLQTYKNWECIIINDGSTDNTEAVAQQYSEVDKRFKYIYQKNAGVSAARNTGLINAKGDYIQFLDADDFLAPKKLELQYEYLENDRAVDIIYGSVLYFDDDNSDDLRQSIDYSHKPWMSNVEGKGLKVVNQLLENNIMVIQSPLIRSKSLNKIGLFDSSLRYNEDWYLWLLCALVGMYFVYDDRSDVLSYVRVHQNSASQNRVKMIVGEVEMRYKIQAKLEARAYYESMKFNVKRIDKLNQSLACMYFERNEYFKAISCFWLNAKYTGEYVSNLRHIVYHLKSSIIAQKAAL